MDTSTFDPDTYLAQQHMDTSNFDPDAYLAANTPTGPTAAFGRGLESTVQPIYTGIASAIDKEPFAQESQEQEGLKQKAWEDEPLAYGTGKVAGIAGEAALGDEAAPLAGLSGVGADAAVNAGIGALGSDWSKPSEGIANTAIGGGLGAGFGKIGELAKGTNPDEWLAGNLLGSKGSPEAVDVVKNAAGIGTKEELNKSATSMLGDLQDKIFDSINKSSFRKEPIDLNNLQQTLTNKYNSILKIDPDQAQQIIQNLSNIVPASKTINFNGSDLLDALSQMKDAKWNKLPDTDVKKFLFDTFYNSALENTTKIPEVGNIVDKYNTVEDIINSIKNSDDPNVMGKVGAIRKIIGNEGSIGETLGGIIGLFAGPGMPWNFGTGYAGQFAGRGVQKALVGNVGKIGNVASKFVPQAIQGVQSAMNDHFAKGGEIDPLMSHFKQNYDNGGRIQDDAPTNAEQMEPGIYGNTDPGNIYKIVNGLASGMSIPTGVEGLANLPEALANLGEEGAIFPKGNNPTIKLEPQDWHQIESSYGPQEAFDPPNRLFIDQPNPIHDQIDWDTPLTANDPITGKEIPYKLEENGNTGNGKWLTPIDNLEHLERIAAATPESAGGLLNQAPQSAEELKTLANTLKKGDVISLPKGSAEYVGVQPGFEEIPDTHLFNAVGKDLPQEAVEGSTYSPETMEKLGMFKNPDMTLKPINQANPISAPTQLPNSGMNALTTEEEKSLLQHYFKSKE